MKFYRFKHLPTGLYYTPSSKRLLVINCKDGTKDRGWVKTNLSKKGKVYVGMPTKKYFKGGFNNHVLAREIMQSKGKFDYSMHDGKFCPYIESEWEIEEIKIE